MVDLPYSYYLLVFAGGKTALLELLAQLSSRSMWGDELCPDVTTRATLNAAIPVTITFNAEMPASPSAYDADPETGLALRILFSALVRSDSLPFGIFWREFFPLGSMLSVQTAVKCCLGALNELAPARRSILLLVDESATLAHASDHRRALRVLTALGSLLDCNPASKLNIVCSTLDAMFLNNLRSTSGRRITYVPLSELSQGASEALFSLALAATLVPGQPLPPAIRVAISDCAGHLRTLECLRHAAQASSPVYTLESLRIDTLARLSGMWSGTPEWAVRAALRGDELALGDVVPGSANVLFCDAITSGTFINTSAVGLKRAVPKLSMMLLLRFADVAPPELALPIRGMAAAEETGCGRPRPSLGGEPFEDFFSHQLRLLTVLESGSDRSMHQLLHVSLAELADPGLPDAVRELLLRPCSLDIRRHSFAQWLAISFVDAVRDSRCQALRNAGIFSFSKTNPAFDVLYLSAPTGTPDASAIAFEVRLTTPRSGSGAGGRVELADCATEIDRKVALFHQLHCGSSGPLARLHVSPGNVLYVYLAAQSISGFDAAARAAYLARGVLVLDRAASEVFLTPTFSGCLLFQERISRYVLTEGHGNMQ